MGDIVNEKPTRNKLDLQQEMTDYSEFLKIDKRKWKKYNILLECIFESIEDNDLDLELRNKVKKIIVSKQASQISLCGDPVKHKSQNLLGIAPNNIRLSYTESSTLIFSLRDAMQAKLTKLNDKCKLLPTIGNSRKESLLELTYNDKVLLNHKSKLVFEQEQYFNNQMQLFNLLQEMIEFRLETVRELSDMKYKEYESEIQLNYIKMELATAKSRVDSFAESDTSLQAFAEIIKHLKEQKKDFSQKIDKLKDLKQKYDDVSCKEYSDILKSYLQYKSALEKKKLMQALWK